MLSSGRGGAMLGTLARGAVSIIRSAMCVLFTTRKGQKTVTSLAYMALLACICQRLAFCHAHETPHPYNEAIRKDEAPITGSGCNSPSRSLDSMLD